MMISIQDMDTTQSSTNPSAEIISAQFSFENRYHLLFYGVSDFVRVLLWLFSLCWFGRWQRVEHTPFESVPISILVDKNDSTSPEPSFLSDDWFYKEANAD